MSKTAVLSGLPLDALTELLAPLPRFRAVQIFKWIAAGAVSFDAMGNIPLRLRAELAEHFDPRPRVTTEKMNADGDNSNDADHTVKLIMRLPDGALIESVLLNDSSGRHTACLSTQAGCPAACVFCKTGAAFTRNLTSAEIVEQFLQLGTIAPIANVVVMGMGEPLLNLTELRRAVSVITGKEGLCFSRRRITVSTCGIARGITELADNGPSVRLALSLTTGDEKLRRRLMPITRNQPLDTVKEALRHFQNRGGGRVTLEAVLLGGINTRDEDAAGIAHFARDLDAVVNIIPWNPVKGLEFEGRPLKEPAANEISAYIRRLESLGLKVTRRYRRGRGVTGACGQLGQS